MPKIKLTQRFVDSATAGDKPKVRLMDTEVPNFGVRIMKAGKKEFILRYQGPDGSTREIAIGDARAIPVETARKRAMAGLGEVAKGADLLADRKARTTAAQERKLRTVEWVVNQYREARELKKKRPRTIDTEDERLNRLVLPKLGDRPVRDLKAGDVETMLEQVARETTRIRATHARAALGLVLSYALRKGWVDFNAAKATEVPVRITERRRLLTDDEIRSVWATKSVAGRALRLALLCVTRANETAIAEWSEFDLEAKVWFINPSHTKKNKQHVVPLSDMALELLAECKNDSRWLFPSKTGEGPIHPHRMTRQANRLCEGETFGPHDLRRTAATRMGAMGFANTESILARVLSHKSNAGSAAMGSYLHYDFVKEKRAFLEAWAKEVARIVKEKADP